MRSNSNKFKSVEIEDEPNEPIHKDANALDIFEVDIHEELKKRENPSYEAESKELQSTLAMTHSLLINILENHPDYWNHRIKMESKFKHLKFFGNLTVTANGATFKASERTKVLIENLEEKPANLQMNLKKSLAAYQKVKPVETKSSDSNYLYGIIDQLAKLAQNGFSLAELKKINLELSKAESNVIEYEVRKSSGKY